MRTQNMIGAFLSMGALAAAPAQAQRVAADVIIRSGPVAGHIVVDHGYSSYTGETVVVHRRAPRRVVVVEHRGPRVIVVDRFRHRKHWKHWKRHGYRPVTVYYASGRYYDRHRPGVREVIVYERDGRYYRGWDDDRFDRHRDRDRDRDRDRHHDRDRWND